MEGFTKIIDILLQEKANLDTEKQLDIEVAIKEIEAKYAERSDKIEAMLMLAGYEEPVEEELDEIDAVEAEEACEAECVPETVEAVSGETFYSI